MTDDLEQLFNDAMAWGMVYGETLCASNCWHEERDKRASYYAHQAIELIRKGEPIIVRSGQSNIQPLKDFIARQKHHERVKKELEEDEGSSQAFNSGGRDYD